MADGGRILVVAAMRSEAAPLQRLTRPDLEVIVTGMGTERARTTTAAALDRGGHERVVVIGIAGGVGPTVAVGDLVVPEVVLDGATGDEVVPHHLGGRGPRGTLHTSDAFVQDPAALAALEARGVVALDMETAAIGRLCHDRGVPWTVLRGISDHVEHLPVDPAVLTITGPDGTPKPAAVARYLLTHPHRAPGIFRLARGARAAIQASTAAFLEALPA